MNSEAAPQGWYPDPEKSDGSQRYWDGAQWTERRQPPPPSVPPPMRDPSVSPSTPAGYTFRDRVADSWPIIAALAAAVLAVVLVVVLVTGGGDSSSSDSTVEPTASSADAEAKEQLELAQTAIETYAVDHNGSYASATSDDLTAIAPNVPDDLEMVQAERASYILKLEVAESGNSFAIGRDPTGEVVRVCDTSGVEGCGTDGSW